MQLWWAIKYLNIFLVPQKKILRKSITLNLFLIIVNRGEWLWNPTKFFAVGFCSLFWPWPCKKHNTCNCLLPTEDLTNRNLLVTPLMATLFAPLMFNGLPNHSTLLTMFSYITAILAAFVQARWHKNHKKVYYHKLHPSPTFTDNALQKQFATLQRSTLKKLLIGHQAMQIPTKDEKQFLTSDINFLNVCGPIVTSFKFQ